MLDIEVVKLTSVISILVVVQVDNVFVYSQRLSISSRDNACPWLAAADVG